MMYPWCKGLLALSLFICVASQGNRITGEIDQIGFHATRGADQTSYLLRTGNNVNKLVFQVPPPKDLLLSGFKVQLTELPTARKLRALLAGGNESSDNKISEMPFFVDPTSIQVLDKGSNRDFVSINGSVKISTIVFIVNVEGYGKPAIDVNKFKGMWVNRYNSKGANQFETMENYFKECSYGKTVMGENNEVVDLTDVVMPAIGRTAITNMVYDARKRCDFQELYAYQEWAQKQFQARGGDMSKYVRRILMLPMNNCPWLGLGSQGCYGDFCYNWIRGDRGYNLNTFFHEIGHTMNLQHSGTSAWEYGDCSCSMGCFGVNGCYNAPTSHRAGWSLPISTVTGDNMRAGEWTEFTIPATEISDTNFVRVLPTWSNNFWKGSKFPAYYFSYRIRKHYDNALDGLYQNKISIHQYNGTNIYDLAMPSLVGGSGLLLGSKFNDSNTGLVLSFYNRNSTTANIKICRYNVMVEDNCFDGLDNDCNGLTDSEDPACKGKAEVCGNGFCSQQENALTCPSDCPQVCGDKLCTGSEGFNNCPGDCPAVCGDGKCQGTESPFNCVKDCPHICGDSYCSGGETAEVCAMDCPAVCGDKFCDRRRGEDCKSCRSDCPDLNCPSPPPAPPAPPPPPPPSPPPTPSPPSPSLLHLVCSFEIVEANAWCATVIAGFYGIEDSTACASYCVGQAKSQPPFCFDYRPSVKHCECSAGPAASERQLGYTSYNYSCKLVPISPYPSPAAVLNAPLPPLPPRPIRRSVQSMDSLDLTRGERVQVTGEGMEEFSATSQTTGLDLSDDYSKDLTSRPAPMDRSLSQDIYVAYNPEYHQPMSDAQSRYAELLLEDGSFQGANMDTGAICGNGICEDGEDAELCAMDCCPATTCGDGKCQAYAGEHCENCPDDCAGDLDGEQGSPFCCGAFVGCGYDTRCTGSQLVGGGTSVCHTTCMM